MFVLILVILLLTRCAPRNR